MELYSEHWAALKSPDPFGQSYKKKDNSIKNQTITIFLKIINKNMEQYIIKFYTKTKHFIIQSIITSEQKNACASRVKYCLKE